MYVCLFFLVIQDVLSGLYLRLCLSFCLPVCLPFSACLSVCQSFCLSVCLSVCLYIYLSVCLYIYPSIYLSIYLCIYVSIFCSVWPDCEIPDLISRFLDWQDNRGGSSHPLPPPPPRGPYTYKINNCRTMSKLSSSLCWGVFVLLFPLCAGPFFYIFSVLLELTLKKVFTWEKLFSDKNF
jgi:hypothetical protein